LLLSLSLTGGILATDSTIRGWPRVTFVASASVLFLSPLYWVFAIPMIEFYWTALVLIGLAASLAGMVTILRMRVSAISSRGLESKTLTATS
jgi:hypothetical protein